MDNPLVLDLLKQIYSKPLAPAGGSAHDGSRPLAPDEFRMFIYKVGLRCPCNISGPRPDTPSATPQVVPCSRKGPHSWIECQYAHPQEKAARRCPVQNTYLPIACPDMKTVRVCLQPCSRHARVLPSPWLPQQPRVTFARRTRSVQGEMLATLRIRCSSTGCTQHGR